MRTMSEFARTWRIIGLGLGLLALGACTSDNPDGYADDGLDDPIIEATDDEDSIESIDDLAIIPPAETDESSGAPEGGSEEVTDYAIADYKAFDPSGIIIRFDFDSDQLNPSAISAMEKIVAGMKQDPLSKIVVRGHADKQGPDDYNDQLSFRRAKAIADYLIKHGIEEERLIQVYLGESEPLVPGATVEAYKQNRRGDFYLDYGPSSFGSPQD